MTARIGAPLQPRPLGVVGRIRVLAEMAGGPFSAVGTTASSGGAAVPQAPIAAVADAQAAVVRPLAGLGTYGVSPFIPAERGVYRAGTNYLIVSKLVGYISLRKQRNRSRKQRTRPRKSMATARDSRFWH